MRMDRKKAVITPDTMAANVPDLHKRDLKDLLRSRYSDLRNLLQQNVTVDMFSTGMFSSGLTVGRSQDVCSILDEFVAGFDVKTSVQELDDHYYKFLEVLKKLGGQVQDIALQLQRGQGEGSATPTDISTDTVQVNEGRPYAK